jgi:adenosine deaminase
VDLLDRFRRRPKAELHLHLEGTLRAARYRAWSREDGASPEGGPLPSGGRFDDFRHFLERFARGCRRIAKSPERIRTLVRDWARSARREGIVYAELTVSPAIFVRLGLPYDEWADALEEELDRAAAAGVETRLILDVVRQWGAPHAAEVLELQAKRPLRRAVAFGLAADETSVPAAVFGPFYEEARRMGLRTTVHAGEWGGPDSVWEALDLLAPDRIAHGIAAVRDPELLGRIVRERIPLDLAVTSNFRTGAVAPGEEHPVGRLVEAGARVTLSTDDPAYFGCTLPGEALRLVRRHRFSEAGVERILDRSFEVAFDREAAKRARNR